MTAYEKGYLLGEMMAEMRSAGDDNYDCRYDLVDAAREGTDYFNAYKRGLEDGLAGRDSSR